jgi:hypothetical protein
MTSADRHRRERPSQAPVPHGLHPYDAIQHNASTVHRPTAQPTTYTETEMDDDRAELHDLGAIRVDAPRHPLGLDRMFERAALRGRPSGASAPVRPASPPQRAAPLALPLPLPLPPGTSTPGASPLAQLFLYPELTPLVLAHLDRPAHLAVAACVCSEWKYTAARRLYADVWVRPWESAPKAKVRYRPR